MSSLLAMLLSILRANTTKKRAPRANLDGLFVKAVIAYAARHVFGDVQPARSVALGSYERNGATRHDGEKETGNDKYRLRLNHRCMM